MAKDLRPRHYGQRAAGLGESGPQAGDPTATGPGSALGCTPRATQSVLSALLSPSGMCPLWGGGAGGGGKNRS